MSPEIVERESVPRTELTANEASSADLTLLDLEDQLPDPPQRREWVRRWASELGKALARTIRDPKPPATPADEEALVVEGDLLDVLHAVAEKMLRGLRLREELVLRMRFGIGELSGHPVKKVAESFAVSRARIRAKALRQLCTAHPVEVRQFLCLLRQLPET